jgi:hypothetical protein
LPFSDSNFTDTEKAIHNSGKDLPMSTRYEFDNESIADFCNNNDVTITFNPDQLDNLGMKGKTTLLVEQLSDVANQLYPEEDALRNFIMEKSDAFHPISFSLYVQNDALWDIMKRKSDRSDKMLPMTTIPWFYWEKEAVGKKNPAGVRSRSFPRDPLIVEFEDDTLVIKGRGGDFYGFLEGRLVDKRHGIRPLVIPGGSGPKNEVPNYKSEYIQVKISRNSAQSILYPYPIDELDYAFSEHPRAFYNHGMQIDCEGINVNLKAGARRETSLHGKTTILIGKNIKETEDTDNTIMFHVWLVALQKAFFL